MASGDDYWDQIKARKRKPAPAPVAPERDPPITAAEMEAIIAKMPAPQITVEPPVVNVEPPKVTVPKPQVTMPAPVVTVKAPDVPMPAPVVTVDLEALLDVSRETLDRLTALVDARTGRLSIRVTDRDDDGNIAGIDVTIQDTTH